MIPSRARHGTLVALAATRPGQEETLLLNVVIALGVSVLALMLPGYLWARVLTPGADYLERCVVGLALGMALVPVCAVGFARVFGTGVTLWIALAAVLLPAALGLALNRVAGSACGCVSEPLLRLPPAGSPVALLVLLAALLLLASAAGRLTPEQIVLSMVVLALAAAGLRAMGAMGRDESSDEGPGADWTWLGRGLLGGFLLLALLRGYVGPARFEWPFLRGVDQYSHAVMGNLMLERGSIEDYLLYPLGFPGLTAVLSRLTAQEPLWLYSALGPVVVLLPALAAWVLARRYWGEWDAVAAAGIVGVVMPGSYLYFDDAMYPNLIASQVLMVLALAYLPELVLRPSWRTGVLTALLGSSVVLYSTVATLYLAILLAGIGVLYVPILLLRDRGRGLALLGTLAFLGGLSVVYAWEPYELPRTVAALLGLGEASEATRAAEMATETQTPYPFDWMLYVLAQPLLWLGTMGCLLLAASYRWARGAGGLALGLLVGWTLLLALGSRLGVLGFPNRFARDLGLPLALLSAWLLVTVLRSVRLRRPVAIAAAAVVCVVFLVAAEDKMTLATGPSPSDQTFLRPEFVAAGRWLREHKGDGNIVISPYVHQVPSRAMLALSGYKGLQSFAVWQLRQQRDIPPAGLEPLLAVQRLMEDPLDSGAAELLRKHDVDYVVLYKEFVPGTMWSRALETCHRDSPCWDNGAIRSRTDLYEVAYENRAVVVLRVRPEVTGGRAHGPAASLDPQA